AGIAGSEFDDIETADELELMIERFALVETPRWPRTDFLAPVRVGQLDFDFFVRRARTRFELERIVRGFGVEAQNPARAVRFLASYLDQFQGRRRRLVAESNLDRILARFVPFCSKFGTHDVRCARIVHCLGKVGAPVRILAGGKFLNLAAVKLPRY